MFTPKRKPYAAIPSSEITPLDVYLSRRRFLKWATLGAGAAALAACGSPSAAPQVGGNVIGSMNPGAPPITVEPVGPAKPAAQPFASKDVDELGDKLNTFSEITSFNNFYEFTEQKEAVASAARGFKSSPWSVTVGGLVDAPRTFDVDDLRKLFDQEERIYRLRCVEGWSMVIPWNGFPLSKLLGQVSPKPEAKYVRFETVLDPAQMPGQRSRWYPWPYIEGLRLDEAMHPLTLLATGMYGLPLTPQNGAPIRLVVPWKYGFKSAKSIVKIDFVAEQPKTFWMTAGPSEYGFYSTVNPDVPHPRWSQSTERRIGELSRRRTLKYNGYAAQVASLYAGMDLKRDF